MQAKFNPTGTHIHKGFLKVRIDLYPEPTDKTYVIHHVQVPVIPPEGYQGAVDAEGSPVDQVEYDSWIDGLPKIWRLNPALCAFVRVSETVIKGELEGFTHQLFNKDTVKTLDDILIKPDSAHWVSPFMRGKLILSDQKVQTKDIVDLIGSVNGRFADLILPLKSNGQIIDIEPQTIDIGAAAIDRNATWNSGWTLLSKDNPANASGTIDTGEIWMDEDFFSDVQIGTFYLVSGTTYKCRDSEVLGFVTEGSKQTFSGLDMSVETGDYMGFYTPAGSLERSSSGYAGVYSTSGAHISIGDEATYDLTSGMAMSVYGTGTVSGLTQVVGGGSIAIAGTLGRNIFISVGAGSVTSTGALSSVLTFFQAVGAGAVTIVGSLASVLTFFKTVGGGSISISGTLNRLIKIGVGAGSIPIVGALGRKIALSVGSGSVAIAGALTSTLVGLFYQAVGNGSVTIAGTLGRNIFLAVGAGSVAIAGTLGRLIKLAVGSGSVGMAGSLVSSLVGVIYQAVGGGAVAISGTLGRLIKISVGDGAVTIAGALVFTINRVLRIFSAIASALKITPATANPLTIASSIGTALAIESTVSNQFTIASSLASALTIKSTIEVH